MTTIISTTTDAGDDAQAITLSCEELPSGWAAVDELRTLNGRVGELLEMARAVYAFGCGVVSLAIIATVVAAWMYLR